MGLLADIFGAGTVLTVERTDEGVDFSMAVGTPLRAPVGGVVHIYPNWYSGQPYVELTMDAPVFGNRVIYYAEQITPHVGSGQRVPAGGWVGRFAASGTGLEAGWGAGGGRTLAQATTGYREGEQTIAGKQFATALGVPILATGQSQVITVSGTAGPVGTVVSPGGVPVSNINLSGMEDAITATSWTAAMFPGASKAATRAHDGYQRSHDTWYRFRGMSVFTKNGGH